MDRIARASLQSAASRLACATLLALAATTGTARAETLVVSMAADPTGFDPEAVMNNTSGFVMATIYDNLVRYKPGTVDVEPGLAETWEVAPDGLTYVFHLRKGVKFHDGTPFDAHAFIDGVDRQLNKANPNYIYNSGPVESYIDFTYGSVASYRAVDTDTVEFKMKEPSAGFLASLAMVWNGVASPAAFAKYGKEFRNHPVGTGPFVFKEWRQRDQVVVDANPDYWKGKPKLDRIVFKEYPDSQAALLALRRNEIQVMGDVATSVIASIRTDSNLQLLTQPGLAISGMAMPNDVAPFTDKRVRQALNYAVDKDAINKALFQGMAITLTSPLPQSQWGFDTALKGYAYDPEKARQLLKEAGVQPGLKVELLSYSSPRGYNPAGADLAVALQGYFKKVGIEAEIRKMDMGAFLSTVRSGKYPGLSLVGWTGDNGDPDNFVGELFNSKHMPVGDTAHYRNPEVDRLMDEAARVPDHDARTVLYRTIQQRIMDDAPWVFVNSVLQIRAIRKEVKGFQLNPTQMFFDMDQVSIEK